MHQFSRKRRRTTLHVSNASVTIVAQEKEAEPELEVNNCRKSKMQPRLIWTIYEQKNSRFLEYNEIIDSKGTILLEYSVKL